MRFAIIIKVVRPKICSGGNKLQACHFRSVNTGHSGAGPKFVINCGRQVERINKYVSQKQSRDNSGRRSTICPINTARYHVTDCFHTFQAIEQVEKRL